MPKLFEVWVLDDFVAFWEIKLEFLDFDPEAVMLLAVDTSVFYVSIDSGAEILNVQQDIVFKSASAPPKYDSILGFVLWLVALTDKLPVDFYSDVLESFCLCVPTLVLNI